MARLTARTDRLLVRAIRVVRAICCALFLLLCVLLSTASTPAAAMPHAPDPASAAPSQVPPSTPAEIEEPDGGSGHTQAGGQVTPENVPGERSWPVGPEPGGGPTPAVVHGWDPPPTPYAAGHRGVDLAAEPGSTVRAAVAGTVRFAGSVAGRRVLSIELDHSGTPPLRITYEPVHADVKRGERVSAGRPVGALDSGPFHCTEGCLHWGLRRDEAYLDPLALLPADLGRRPPSRLLPVFGVPEPRAPGLVSLPGSSPPLREWLLISLLTAGGCWAQRRLRPRRTLRPSGPGRPRARVAAVLLTAAFSRRRRAGPSRRRPP